MAKKFKDYMKEILAKDHLANMKIRSEIARINVEIENLTKEKEELRDQIIKD